MDDIGFLFADPRPDLPDTKLWDKLLRAIPTLENKVTANLLQRRFWTIRSAGAVLNRIRGGGFDLKPDLGERCAYDSEEEFEDMKQRFLKPYSPAIHEIMRKVDGQE